VTTRIAIIGDRDPDNPNHLSTEAALAHSATALGLRVESIWFATDALLDSSSLGQLARSNGVFCTTGSPYRSLEGALRAIRLARERRVPFLGTCGGFQHAVIEYARNVLGLTRANHGEYADNAADALIAPLECSLAGQTFEVALQAASRAAACYGQTQARERYYCSYGVNPSWQEPLGEHGLPIVGTAADGTPRIMELPDHPFFVATLFVPQSRSTAEEPHPLVSGFVRAAARE
jgi:CTP synthase (UTP-ammonia lyase)